MLMESVTDKMLVKSGTKPDPSNLISPDVLLKPFQPLNVNCLSRRSDFGKPLVVQPHLSKKEQIE